MLQSNNSYSLIHLLNIANVIPFIASSGIHFVYSCRPLQKKTKQKQNKTLLSTEEKDYMDQHFSETNLS